MILLDKDLPTEPAERVLFGEAEELIKKLEYELAHSSIPGVGLSCPQIGINKAAAIIRIKTNDPLIPVKSINLVNPVLIEASNLILFTEGCLSFPNKSVKTIRYSDIVIETLDDYDYYAEQMTAKRSNRSVQDMALFNDKRIRINVGMVDTDDEFGKLLSVAVQHETSHLIALNFFDFAPKEVGRNDKCVCNSGKKSKKCCDVKFFNTNLLKLFKPNYR